MSSCGVLSSSILLDIQLVRLEVIVRMDSPDARVDHAPVHIEQSYRGNVQDADEEELPEELPSARVVQIGKLTAKFYDFNCDVVDRLWD